MKTKVFLTILVMAFAVCFFTSCNTNNGPKQSITEQEIRVIEPDFFYVVKEVVKSGYTTWDRAKVYYGSGLRWTDIVAQNRFLQEPGRVWQDTITAKWYVLIFPGEELIMGTTKVNPVFVENIDAPVQPKSQQFITNNIDYTISTLWAWIIIVMVLIAFIVVFLFLWLRRRTESNSQSQNVHVNIGEQSNIDLETRRAILQYEQGFRNRTLAIVENGANKGELVRFNLNQNSTDFHISGEFRDGRKINSPTPIPVPAPPTAPEEKPEEKK